MSVKYESGDVKEVGRTAIIIPCPDCGVEVTIKYVLEEGCVGCGKEPWAFRIEP